MDWFTLFCYSLCTAMLTLTVLGLGVSVFMPGMNRWNRRFFTALFTVLLLLMGAFLVDLIVYEFRDMALAEQIDVYFQYLLVSLPMPMFTGYLLHLCGEDLRKSTLFRLVIGLWGIYFILLGIAQCTTFLYYVTPDNEFIRGSWHPLLVAPLAAIMLLNLAGVIRRRNRLPDKYYVAFLIHLLPMTVATLIHAVIYVPLLVVFGLGFSMLSMFGIILCDQIEQYMRQQREIAHQRASIMVLQMRPHFIFNTMMSIYYLCAQDSKKAQQVTLDFTSYLRKNFSAIASENTIPFSNELEHTRAYLAVEQVQFEDGLFVEYDTPHTRFRVPPLTLQPIVENAVKHGMDPDSAPLRICIRTRETDAGHEITVEDNGPGFAQTNMDESEPHIALANIQQRLEIMCGGKLTVMPREGGGTVVKITLPVLQK
ncbi:Histidine kinase-, DNA gyrase B-, and HSP90-like ATPase [Succiniclasticum ruminis]|uniref:Histidine kinase-, DNA gyrase B-, and HSP90-like ATPase n=1 Tax=Succiniclasticum ruminis TaxID=40841 RepID=A0A1G6M019_9FIRM|nr:histidine kinase [Succiniclasticum ruminis]SDC48863.1 Histidine kinase-, DNA gyrase B-, and HSP90-like ATPase [Succiniclasticum ruminis]